MHEGKQTNQRGFSLFELILTAAVLAVISTAAVLVLNPAETLRKTRDTQRINDLSRIKVAIDQFLNDVPDGYLRLDNNLASNDCNTDRWVSDSATTDETIYDGSDTINATESGVIDGTGWLPVPLTAISGLKSLTNYPVDPVNNVCAGTSSPCSVTSNSLMYIYACEELGSGASRFEIITNLESSTFRNGGQSDKESKDGGNYDPVYEVGTNLQIMFAP